MFQTCDAVHQGLCSPAFSVIALGLCSVHITYYSLVDHSFSLTLCVWGHYMYECVCTSVWICRAHKLASGVSSIFTYFFESGSLTDWWGWLVTSSRTPISVSQYKVTDTNHHPGLFTSIWAPELRPSCMCNEHLTIFAAPAVTIYKCLSCWITWI